MLLHEIADMLLRGDRGWYLEAMLEIVARAHGASFTPSTFFWFDDFHGDRDINGISRRIPNDGRW